MEVGEHLRARTRALYRRVAGAERYHRRFPQELRASVGGRWDAMGELQKNFLLAQGLQPDHDFLDVGCGALRAGIQLMPHLEPGRYCGMDASADILAAARVELERAGLQD